MSREMSAPELTLETEDIERKEIAALAEHRDVVAIAPVMPMKLISPVDRNNVESATLGNSWGVDAVQAHTSPYNGRGIVVSVLDTGIDSSHPAFSGVELVERDFSNEGNGDQIGHGTHCAGTIFGRDTGGMRIGVARGVEKALIGKVFDKNGSGTSKQICDAILWAIDAGANVISMSIGLDFPGFVKRLVDYDYPIEVATSLALEGYRTNIKMFEAFTAMTISRIAFLQACVMIAAAGNESRREINPDWEVAVSPPAIAEGIISVAALEGKPHEMGVAKFSNTGANISAPGVNIISAAPGGGLALMSGTSMATPHVAGVAALWAQKLLEGGRLKAFELTARVVGSAVTQGLVAGFDPFDTGAGLVQAPQM